MSEQQKCLEGGYLVGTADPLPEDPHEYYRDEKTLVGCNRLFCRGCGMPVKVFSGYRKWGGPKSRDEMIAFYESDDPTAWSFLSTLQAGETVRVYRCKCNSEQTPGIKLVDDLDLGWYCAGHPAR